MLEAPVSDDLNFSSDHLDEKKNFDFIPRKRKSLPLFDELNTEDGG